MRHISVIIAISLITQLKIAAQSGVQYFPVKWTVGYNREKGDLPKKWVPATVPGAVQLDYAKAENYGPYSYADNWKDYLWMEDVYWTYQATFSKPVLSDQQAFIFNAKGIDYKFDVLLNGEIIKSQEGMFTPVVLDLTDKLKDKNNMQVRIYPIPKLKNVPPGRAQASQSVKPAVSYGWDWHPRLVPSGIWDSTWFVVRDRIRIENYAFDYNLSKNLDTARIFVSVNSTLPGGKMDLTLTDRMGNVVMHKETGFNNRQAEIRGVLENPVLWWSWDQGDPYLYNLEIRLMDKDEVVDNITRKVGFRSVKLVMNPGTWNVEGFPKSRANPPITLELNGRRIFCRGSNWVNPEIFPGIITRSRYQELLDLALHANFNLLRVWGGGIINKDSFYEICDSLGIMVWQEFPLACNNYIGSQAYLSVLRQEATSIIERLKPYPSLVMWCGGNELFNNWSGMTDQSMALRMLNSLTFELDPLRPFIMTSPVMGMGHGNYVFKDFDTNEEVFQRMPKAHNTAYTEFGVPSPSSVEVLKTFIPEAQLWPPRPGTVWETHHAYHAWVGNTWLQQDLIESYFGPSKSLEDLIGHGQLIQSQGYKCIFEEGRRQKPYCSMVLNWCFNEPWPTAANNSLVNYPAIPKAAYYTVMESCRPVLASARIPKFSWKAGEEFSVDLFMLNDSPDSIPPGKMIVKILGDEEIRILEWNFPEVPANQNLEGPSARISLPEWESEAFDLELEIEGRKEYNSVYTLLLKK